MCLSPNLDHLLRGFIGSGNNSCHSWCHDWCEPSQTVIGTLGQEVTPTKEEKIKIKQVKPVLHFIPNEDGTSDVIQYSQKGMKVLDGGREKLEQYLRDQVEIDVLGNMIIKLLLMRNLVTTDQRR